MIEKIPNIDKMREAMYSDDELPLYTLEDMMREILSEQDGTDENLESALYQLIGQDAYIDVDPKRREISISVSTDPILSVQDMQSYQRLVKEAAQSIGADYDARLLGIRSVYSPGESVELVFGY